MFRNVYYNKRNSEIHLWYTENNKNYYMRDKWAPHLYIKSKEKTNIKNIFGENVIKKKFNTFNQYNKYQKEKNDIFEDGVIPELQYLSEKYHKINDEDIVPPYLKIVSLDIEVYSDTGEFPNPTEAKFPIPLITLNEKGGEVYTFGLFPFNGNESTNYYQFVNELKLLRGVIDFICKLRPDIITGWHIIANKKMNTPGFDIPYIINRYKNLSDDEYYKNLSPVKKVSVFVQEDKTSVIIHGITLIDYMVTYKWYSRNNPESYSLDFISKLELKQGKLDYSQYGSLNNLYEQNWDLYVDYNIIDTKRVIELEKKLKYIKLIQTLSLITRSPMRYYMGMTTIIEGRMLNYYRNNNYCAPKKIERNRVEYPAAYVKEPVKNLYKWLISIDIASSYPTAIITLNMSPETYIGRICEFTEEEIIHYTSKRNFPSFIMNIFWYENPVLLPEGKIKFSGEKLDKFNKMLKRGLISIAPNGSCFKTKPKGVFAHVEHSMFLKRKEIKKKMRETTDKEKIENLDTTQNALKTLLNSMYGMFAYPFGNRYMNADISKAITSCGRHAIRQGEKFSNELLNNPNDELKNIIQELKEL